MNRDWSGPSRPKGYIREDRLPGEDHVGLEERKGREGHRTKKRIWHGEWTQDGLPGFPRIEEKCSLLTEIEIFQVMHLNEKQLKK